MSESFQTLKDNLARGGHLYPGMLLRELTRQAQTLYEEGKFRGALQVVEEIYRLDAARPDNLLLLGAVHFQLRNFADSVFFNQQCIQLEPSMAEAYNNLGIALREVGDGTGSAQFLLRAIKLKPRYADAYNNLGTTHMSLGKTEEAIETYKMCLVLDPGMVDALCNLGSLYKALGELEEARKCYLRAIKLKPEFPIAWSNLAGIVQNQGQLETAVSYFREATRLCPEFADAYSNLGTAVQEQGSFEDAKQCYENAIKLKPDLAIAHGNLGACLLDMGDTESAIHSLQKAVEIDQNYPDAHSNLGIALRTTADKAEGKEHGGEKNTQRRREAILSYRTALRLKPDHPYAYCNLGCALRDRGMIKEAIHCNVTAARLMPECAAAHSNIGALLQEQGQLEQAMAHYNHAIIIDPELVEAHFNLAQAHSELGRTEDSVTCLERAIELNPELPEARCELGKVLCAQERYEEAIDEYTRALELGCDGALAGLVLAKMSICLWDDRDVDHARLANVLEAQLESDNFQEVSSNSDDLSSNSEKTLGGRRQKGFHGRLPCVDPVAALALPQLVSPKTFQRITRRYAARALGNVALTSGPFEEYPRMARTNTSQRLRVGYLSGRFSPMLASVFKHHDRSAVHVTCYTTRTIEDSELRRALEKVCEGGAVDLSTLSRADAAEAIHGDNIHVLVSLDGHLPSRSNNEILSLRPAPVQVGVVFGGHPGTLGADYVDSIVLDNQLLQSCCCVDGEENVIDEDVVSVRQSFVNAHADMYPEIVKDSMIGRVDCGLPDDAFVFVYHGSLDKIDPATFDVWSAILKKVPHSLLWLPERPGSSERHMKIEAEKRGVDPSRFVFALERRTSLDLVRRLSLADCALQPLAQDDPQATLDSLWAGTPLVAHKRPRTAQSLATVLAASFLVAVGCEELVAESPEEYVEVAVRLATNHDSYRRIRVHIQSAREEEGGLFDTRAQVADLESAMRERFFLASPAPNG